MAAELQGVHIGGWAVGPYLNNGFSAVVLEAEKEGQKAALKIIDPAMVERAGAKKQLTRILRETELAGHGHPNLVEIFDGGKCAKTDYLFVVMELLPWPTLAQLRQGVPAGQIAGIIAQAARAAKFLEDRGIAHRDIKPGNIVAAPDYSLIKLLDLGVIHPPSDPNDPSAGTGDHFVGTARYSPPEFLYRDEEDTVEAWRAITFYQLGATLYDLLMRRSIFDEFREPPAKLYQAVKDHIPVIDTNDVDFWLVDLARRCLHKNWRVRKEIVKWEDFEGTPKPPEFAAKIKERLRKRFEGAAPPPTVNSEGVQKAPTRRTLEQLAGSVATSSREVCQQGGIFPPVEINHTAADGELLVTLRTGPSPDHELDGAIEIRLVVRPLDARAEHICLTGTARLGAPLTDGHQEPIELFVGAASDPALRDVLDIFLHAALELGAGTGIPPAGGLALRPIVKGT